MDIGIHPEVELSFLIDTGAQTSILKRSVGHPKTIINRSSAVNLNGITGKLNKTYGTVKGSLSIPNGSLEQVFHVVDSSISLKFDGLLGGDFLSKFRASISYDHLQLSLTIPNHAIQTQHLNQLISLSLLEPKPYLKFIPMS